jgi:hypothetical protein
VLTLQRECEELSNGYTIHHKGNSWDFKPTFRHRWRVE